MITKTRPLSSDPNDDMVLDVAINGRADAIVTQNAKHFAPAARGYGIKVTSPAEFLQALREKEQYGNESRKASIDRFPLRLMPSVRRTAEAFSEKEDVSLNQFINVAVAEKLAHLEHDEWLKNHKKPNAQAIAKALYTLDHDGGQETEEGDELPASYQSVRGEYASLSFGRRKA